MPRTRLRIVLAVLVCSSFMALSTFDTRSATMAETPTFSVAAGTYSTIQNVTVSSATLGATICYTENGINPTANGAGECAYGSKLTSSTVLNVSSTKTIKAIATASGYADSAVASATYAITGIQGPITHVATDYNAGGATTVVSPLVYHTQGNLIAVFVLGGVDTSSVTDTQGNTYTVVDSTPTDHGEDGMWFYAFANASGDNTVTATFVSSAMYRSIQVLEYSNIDSVSPVDQFTDWNGATSGTFSTATANELILAGYQTNQKGRWVAGTDYTLTPDSSYYDSLIVVRPVEQRITSSVLTNTTTTISQLPTANVMGGWEVSFKGAVSAEAAASPTFSLPGGTYTAAQSVTLSSALAGATICYTVDGTTPGATVAGTCDGGSTLTYSTPVNVAASQTIKAIATKAGSTNSVLASAIYVIDASAVITFTTSGQTFAPMIVVEGNPTISWVFDVGGTNTPYNTSSPSHDFGVVGTHTTTLTVTPWSAVKAINVGYARSNGGSYNIPLLAGQNVSAVSGLNNVAPYLRIWASDKNVTSNTIASLDFSNFTALEEIECEGNDSLASIELHNTPVLKRIVTEECNNLPALDLSETPLLEDLRDRASAGNVAHTITWGSTGKYLWHLCAGARNMLNNLPIAQFPNLEILYITSADQAGILDLNSPRMDDVLQMNGNSYTEAYLSGAFASGAGVTVQINGNQLTVLDVSNDPGLVSLDASNNKLSQWAVDRVLRDLDANGNSGGTVILTGNAAPSSIGQTYITSLQAKSWTVTTAAVAAAAPAFSLAGGDYFSAQTVTLESATNGAAICYTTNGTNPAVNGTYDGCATGTLYASAITISSNQTLKAVAAKSGYASSPVARAAYRITGPVTQVETTYQAERAVSVAAPAVTHTSGNLIAVFLSGHNDPGTLSVTDSLGNLYVAAGAIHPASAAESVNGQWFYTYSNSTGSNVVTGAFSNSAEYRTIRVLEYANIVPSSPVDVYATGLGATSPVFTTTVANELILTAYHIENQVTSCTAGQGYSLLSPCSVRIVRPAIQRVTSAIQTNTFASIGYTSSASSSVAGNWTVSFKLATGTDALAPTFSVAEGSYNTIQSVTLNSGTAGSTICYTVDGSTPATDGAGNCAGGSTRIYSNAIRVSTSQTIKAVATKSGSTDSPINSVQYVITGIQGPITQAYTKNTAAAATSIAAPAATHTQGNLIAVFIVMSGDPGATTVADEHKTYTAVGTMTNPYTSSAFFGQWFYAIAPETTSDTVTATFTNSVTYRSIRVLEYANIDASSPIDIFSSGKQGATAIFTTTAPNALILTGWHVQSGSLSSCTTPSGYTLLADDDCSTGTGRPVEQKITSSVQTNVFAAMGRTSNGSSHNTGWMVSFKGASTPTFSPVGGTYSSTQSVSLTSTIAGATLCYTEDGSDPTTNGAGSCSGTTKTYSSAISVASSKTIRAVETKSGSADSVVANATYAILTQAATPTLAPSSGTFAAAQNITITSATAGATICYTTDGITDPVANGAGTCTTGNTYTVPFSVATTTTIRAIASKSGFGDSAVNSEVYTITAGITGPVTQAIHSHQNTPSYMSTLDATATHTQGNLIAVFVAGEGHPDEFTVTDSQGNGVVNNAGAYIYTPVEVPIANTTHTNIYGQWFYAFAKTSGSNTVTVRSAISMKNMSLRVLEYSNIDTTYPVDVSVAGGGATTPAFTTTSPNEIVLAAWHAQGTPTTCSAGSGYNLNANDECNLAIARPVTQKVVASIQNAATTSLGTTGGSVWSSWVVSFRRAAAVAPTFSSAAGIYDAAQNITLASTTAGATICYTIDGSSPTADNAGTCTHGTTYTGAISVSGVTTIRALTTMNGLNDSVVSIADYTINLSGHAVVPVFSLPAGTYATGKTIMLTTSDGSAICYTTNGVDPAAVTAGTCSSGTQIASGGTVTIADDTTIKALATQIALINSELVSKAYVIDSAQAIAFTTSGATFQPLLKVQGNPSIVWEFSDGTIQNIAAPTSVNFGAAGTRTQHLIVTPWNAVTSINVGYDGGDSGSLTIDLKAQQNVTQVSGLSHVAPYLKTWASSQNASLTTLDFSNFTALNTIECYDCHGLSSVNLTNTPALSRLDLESNSLDGVLDLSTSPNIADLRGTSNDLTQINWPTNGLPYMWHMCSHSMHETLTYDVDYPTIADMTKFPSLIQIWIRDDAAPGTFDLVSTNARSIWGQRNSYTTVDLSNAFPTGTEASVDFFDNRAYVANVITDTRTLTSMILGNDPGLESLNAYGNALTNLNLADVTAMEHLDIHDNQIAGILDITNNDALTYLDISTNQITGLDVSGATGLYYLDAHDNNLTESAVDAILQALVTNGKTAGYLDLSGTNAPSSSAGQVNAATLIERGWVVSTAGSTLVIGKAGNGGTGTITVTSPAITCGSSCTAATVSVTSGTEITLTAAADGGSAFSGWTLCDGDGTNCTTTAAAGKTLTLTADKFLTATFTTAAPAGIHGPITHAETINSDADDITGVSAPTVTHTQGNLIAVFVAIHDTATVFTIADTQGNDYYPAGNTVLAGGTISGQWFYAFANQTSLNTVTASFAAENYATIRVLEYTNIDPVDPVDIYTTASGQAFTTNNANELVLAALHTGASSCTSGSGYTLTPNDFCGAGTSRPVEQRITTSVLESEIATFGTPVTPDNADWVVSFNAASSEASLSGLTLSQGTLAPAFASGTTSYTASIANDITSMTVTPTATEGNSATITVNGTAVTSGVASGAINLNVGANVITIVITAPDMTIATYTLTVTRASSNDSTLNSLTISQGTLAPAFASGTTSYTAGVASGISTMTVTPTVNQADATVTVEGIAVTSGSASGNISLGVGDNTINIVVTAQDTTTTEYVIIVTRAAASTDASLSGLTVSSGTLSPVFASGTETYTDSVANGVASVTVVPTATAAGAAITVNGTATTSGSVSDSIPLSIGSNAITIVVTAPDTTTTNTYAITVTRAAGSSSGGGGGFTPTVATPTFSPLAGTYGSTQIVTISTSTSGATIFYTLDGSMPTTASTAYASLLTISVSTTIKALAARDNYRSSAAATATYTITGGGGGDNEAPAYADGTLLKLADSFKVYVIIDGKKKWISTPEVFEQLGYAWTNINVVSADKLDSLVDYEDNLIRAIGDYKVYLVVSGVKRHIPNPSIFLDYGFKWEEVKDVPPETVGKYPLAYLIRESGKNDIYFISSNETRKHIPNMAIFNSYSDKLTDVQIVSKTEMDSYPLSNLIKLSYADDVYFLSGNTKQRIPNPTVFAQHNFDWGRVVIVNETEFRYYSDGGELK